MSKSGSRPNDLLVPWFLLAVGPPQRHPVASQVDMASRESSDNWSIGPGHVAEVKDRVLEATIIQSNSPTELATKLFAGRLLTPFQRRDMVLQRGRRRLVVYH